MYYRAIAPFPLLSVRRIYVDVFFNSSPSIVRTYSRPSSLVPYYGVRSTTTYVVETKTPREKEKAEELHGSV